LVDSAVDIVYDVVKALVDAVCDGCKIRNRLTECGIELVINMR
jgi:hypothetical protein